MSGLKHQDGYELLSVILPVYGAASYVESSISDLTAALAALPIEYELLPVINGPDDGTEEICQRIAALDQRVRVLRSERAGWAFSVRHGLANARGDLICFTNSSRTRGTTLAYMLDLALRYPGLVVKANRLIRDNWKRRLGSLIYNIQCRWLFELPNFDINGTPKIFPRVHEPLMALRRSDDLIDLEFNLVCRDRGYPMIEVPVRGVMRLGGESTTNYGSAVKFYLCALSLWLRRRRRVPTEEGSI